MRCEDGDIYRVIKALEENKSVEYYVMQIDNEDVYTFKPMKIDSKQFCEEYKKMLGFKNRGCLCGWLKKLIGC
jgi:hypothetical protein